MFTEKETCRTGSQGRLCLGAVQLWSSGMAGAEGSEGTLGSHEAAYQPMVQAERTGLNPYFTTKSLETKLQVRGFDHIITQGFNMANPSLFPNLA